MNGPGAANQVLDWTAGSEFFDSFGNAEVLCAALRVHAEVSRAGNFIGVTCTVEGSVTVPCDRCLDPLPLDVETEFALSVKFGPHEERTEADDREIVMLPYGEAELDLAQFVYDYVWTSLPMQRVHPDGECNEEAIKYLCK